MNSANDYSPFGMLMPERTFSDGGGYRWGFNGMEGDDEIKGSGNHVDFGARGYDPRNGRWWVPDPFEAKYPSVGTYNYSLNNPLIFFDPDGNKVFATSEEAKQIIKWSVTPEEAQFIEFDEKGEIDVVLMRRGRRKLSTVGGNFKDLLTLVKDKRIVEVIVADEIKAMDGNGKILEGDDVPMQFNDPEFMTKEEQWELSMGESDKTGTNIEGETYEEIEDEAWFTGSVGISLFPFGTKPKTEFDKRVDESLDKSEKTFSTNGRYQVFLNRKGFNFHGLNRRLTGTFAHEAFGHILSELLGKSRSHGPHRTDQGDPTKYNEELERQIDERSTEAKQNYDKHNK